MQKQEMMLTVAVLLGAAGIGSAMVSGCNDGGGNNNNLAQFTQVERLAMPAINEGLVVQNTNLNNFNAITPDLDNNPNNDPAIAAVLNDAVATLDAVDQLDANDNVSVAAIVAAFIPDVMRIDTNVASPVGNAAFATAANIDGRPTAGRKLEDDVMDTVLTVLVGAAVTDNVPYTRPAAGAGSTNPALGHDLLSGQIAANGAATFPFLADPN